VPAFVPDREHPAHTEALVRAYFQVSFFRAKSLGDRGSCTFYQYRPGHSALERLLEMVTSACDRGTAPTGATTPQTGGFPSA
jgi:hypothetical protein